METVGIGRYTGSVRDPLVDVNLADERPVERVVLGIVSWAGSDVVMRVRSSSGATTQTSLNGSGPSGVGTMGFLFGAGLRRLVG